MKVCVFISLWHWVYTVISTCNIGMFYRTLHSHKPVNGTFSEIKRRLSSNGRALVVHVYLLCHATILIEQGLLQNCTIWYGGSCNCLHMCHIDTSTLPSCANNAKLYSSCRKPVKNSSETDVNTAIYSVIQGAYVHTAKIAQWQLTVSGTEGSSYHMLNSNSPNASSIISASAPNSSTHHMCIIHETHVRVVHGTGRFCKDQIATAQPSALHVGRPIVHGSLASGV